MEIEKAVNLAIEKHLGAFKDNLATSVLLEIANLQKENDNSISELKSKNQLSEQKLEQASAAIKQYQQQLEQAKSTIQSEKEKFSKLESESKRQNMQAKEKMDELQNQIADLEKNNKRQQSEKNSLQEKNSEYQNKYGTIENAFENFQKLEDKTKNVLENLFNPECDVVSFLSSGMDEDAVKSLYNTAKDRIVNKRGSDNEALVEVYNFFLYSVLNKPCKPAYEKIVPQLGDEYNESRHISLTKGKSMGKISKVVLLGFESKNLGKQQALVEIQ